MPPENHPHYTLVQDGSKKGAQPGAKASNRRKNRIEGKEQPIGGQTNLYADLTVRGLFRRELQLVGHPGQVRQRSGLHLSHDLAAMNFYSGLADADVVRDLLVEAASHDQGHNLTLAGGEGLEARPQRGDCLFVLQPRAISLEAQLDRVQQVLIAERFCQELDRSSFYRLDGHRDVAMSGDEDDRNVNVGRRELSLKIETTSAGQSDIEDEARGAVRAPFAQEFGNRSQGLGLHADRSDQAAERLADPRVVIDDDDGRLFGHR